MAGKQYKLIAFRDVGGVSSRFDEIARANGVRVADVFRDALDQYLVNYAKPMGESGEELTENVKWRMMSEMAISMRMLIESSHPELKQKISAASSEFKRHYGLED